MKTDRAGEAENTFSCGPDLCGSFQALGLDSGLPDLRLQDSFFLRKGFPNSSVGKESTCSARDPGWIPGLGKPPGEGIGYPLQYSWAAPVAQLVKNLPATWETWVRSLGGEVPPEKRKATHSSILAGRIPWTSPWGCEELDSTERLSFLFFSQELCCESLQTIQVTHLRRQHKSF